MCTILSRLIMLTLGAWIGCWRWSTTLSICALITAKAAPGLDLLLLISELNRDTDASASRAKTRKGLESFAICTIYDIIYPQTPYRHTGLSSLARLNPHLPLEEHLWDRHLGSTKEHLSHRVGFSSIQSLPSSIQSPCGCLMQQREGVAPMLP